MCGLFRLVTDNMLSSAGDDTELGVSDCLRFFTGVEQVPPVGFDVGSTLNFNNSSVYPYSIYLSPNPNFALPVL